jgi:hypothetical protein
MRANIPGALPKITRATIIELLPPTPSPIPTAKRVRIAEKHATQSITTKSTTTLRRSNRLVLLQLRNPRIVSREALAHLLIHESTADMLPFTPTKLRCNVTPPQNFAHYAMPMIHPITGKSIGSYKRLMQDPATAETWMTAFGKDFGGMCQGDDKTGQLGTNAVFVMTPSNVPLIPTDRTVTYARVVIDHCPQKADPNRIQITAGGNLINYPGKLTTRTTDVMTAKLLWNSMLSMPEAKNMCLDIKKFYLSAPLDCFEYMRIPYALFPPWIVEQYALQDKVLYGNIYMEMRRAMWGLPQAGILANKLLKKRLAPHGYFECTHTPGLWRHATRPITFTLVVNDFGVKYTQQEDMDHLIECIKKKYKLTKDWDGNLYCTVRLKWDYKACTLDISMPGYILKQLQKYKHASPS